MRIFIIFGLDVFFRFKNSSDGNSSLFFLYYQPLKILKFKTLKIYWVTSFESRKTNSQYFLHFTSSLSLFLFIHFTTLTLTKLRLKVVIIIKGSGCQKLCMRKTNDQRRKERESVHRVHSTSLLTSSSFYPVCCIKYVCMASSLEW
jgi:hypothetical protein